MTNAVLIISSILSHYAQVHFTDLGIAFSKTNKLQVHMDIR